MKKEDIEKAATQYAQTFIEGSITAYNSFKAGADWRINSVWHGKELTPEEHKEILVKIVGDNGEVETWVEEYNNEYHALENSGIDWEEVLTWAYINDLLRTKGERE